MTDQDRDGFSVLLTVRDMPASVRFYRDRLGFEMGASFPNEREAMWCRMVLDEQPVMLCTAVTEDDEGESCEHASTADRARFEQRAEDLQRHKRGVGVAIYLRVANVDEFHDELRERGVEIASGPTNQVYEIREMTVDDPDGYELVFFTPVSLPGCQSCGVPLTDARPGQKYCPSCTSEGGELRSYQQVFEGTVTGFFMAMHKLPRGEAEQAAREHLRKMPAWSSF